jgi:hypothetical protein
MRAIVQALGVDYDQWRALTVASLKLDYRNTTFGSGQFGRQASGAGLIIGQLVFYTMFGAFMGVVAWFVRDLFTAATFLMTYVCFIVGTVVLLDHNSALTSPVDYPVLGFRPISSRTYLAARLANVVVYTSAITAIAAYIPTVVLFWRHGTAVGLAAVAAFSTCSVGTAMALLFGYASMVRWIGAGTIRRALSYLQLAISFFVYGGYFLLSQTISTSLLAGVALTKAWWLLALPPAWFASYLEIAAGRAGLFEISAAALSLAALAAMLAGLGGRLSLEYSERLGALLSASDSTRAGRRGPARAGWWFRSGEGRSMAILIRSQFRNDQRFRLTVLGILPLTLIYLMMGVQQGTVVDPFERAEEGGPSLVVIAVLLFPSMLRVSIAHSDAFRASWIFFASPANRIALVRAAKNVLVAFFLLPYLAFVTVVYLFIVPRVTHVVVHMLLLGLLSHLALLMGFLVNPELPFAKPPSKGRSSGLMFAFMFFIMFAAITLQMAGPAMYRSLTATSVVFLAVIGASAVADRLMAARIEQRLATMEFLG